MTADHSTTQPGPPFGRRFAEVLLIVLMFFVAAGDPPPDVNEPHYLCRLKHYWNPQWCAGDLFLESTDTQLVFIWTFGWVTRWLSLPAAAWVGRLLAWTFLAWAWQRLSWRIVPRPLVAVLSAALFVTLNERAHLAGEWIVGGVEGKCFAYGFVILALRELVDRRWNRLWLALGAATAFHPLVGGWSALMCGGIWLTSSFRQLKISNLQFAFRNLFLRQAPLTLFSVAGAGFLASLGILPALMLTWNEPAEIVAEASRIYVFDRLPHHLALLTLPTREIVVHLVRHSALLIALWGLSAATGGSTVAAKAGGPPAATRYLVQFAWGAALLAVVGFAIELALWNQPLVAARLLRYYWFRLTDFAAPMAVSICAAALIVSGLERKRNWAAWVLLLAVLAPGLHLTAAARQRVLKPIPPADAKVRDYAAWVAACEWVAENTPPDALFLTPRLNLSFKWRAGRAEVATRKDIPQDARNIVEWHRRLRDIYYTRVGGVKQPLDSLGILGTERVRKVARKYNADYVLMDRGQLLSLPRAYWNEEYVVYRIEETAASRGE